MRALVTGGGGFLGGAIVRLLRGRGDGVRSFARGDYPALAAAGVEVVRGDLADLEAVTRAVAGCEVVFHVAAKAGVWGGLEEYRRANVIGTQNVLAACRHCRVPRLVFTSTPSVTFAGADQEGVDESAPYAESYLAHYPRTKAEAERLVLAANAPELATVALRPHLIWGPGDPNLVPRLLDRGRRGKLRRVGARPNRVDSTFIDNAAQAHLLAADRLAAGGDAARAVAGRAYFISNGEPLPMHDLINKILAAGHVPPMTRTISAGAAWAAGAALELAYKLAGRADEPPMTRFVARQLATAHWFDIGAARRDLGYVPRVTIDEGMRRLEEHLRGQHDGRP